MPHKLSVIVTVGGPVALQSLNGANLIAAALTSAYQFSRETSLSNRLYVATKDIDALRNATRDLSIDFLELQCDPTKPGDLARALEPLEFEMVAIHDAQRPLTRSAQFHRTLEGLFGCDAVRPTMAFTETLKAVNESSELTHTIDRTKVRRISSPEIIRRTVIDFGGNENTWTLPLTKEARLSEVEADPESVRINSADEVTLMEAFLHWQQKIAK
ncbi:MAG: 2-C-methyl-D-erythritol 4-phosphate cytidylyltransferase [Candidatus Nanopelagicaceae bacterium]